VGNLVKYGGWTDEQVDRDEAEMEAGDIYKMKSGSNIVRFIPPLPGKNVFVRFKQHFITLPGNEFLVFVCPRFLKPAQSCPSCDKGDSLKMSRNSVDKNRAWKLYPTTRILGNGILRTTPELGPKVIPFGKKVHDQLVQLRRKYGDFTDPTPRGFDLDVMKTGQGLNTEYNVQRETPSPLSKSVEQINEWITKQHDLRLFVPVLDPDEIAEKLGVSQAMSFPGVKGGSGGASSTAEDDFFVSGEDGDNNDDDMSWIDS
jgi:hypothetical protein